MKAEVIQNYKTYEKLNFKKVEPSKETRNALDEYQRWLICEKIDPNNKFYSIEEAIRRTLGLDWNDEVKIVADLDEAIADDKSGFLETLYLNSIPGLAESIIEEAKTPWDELIDESKVDWK